jgi:hypothetical protein
MLLRVSRLILDVERKLRFRHMYVFVYLSVNIHDVFVCCVGFAGAFVCLLFLRVPFRTCIHKAFECCC